MWRGSVVLLNSIRGWALRGPSGGERLRWVIWDRSLGERAPQTDNLVARSHLRDHLTPGHP